MIISLESGQFSIELYENKVAYVEVIKVNNEKKLYDEIKNFIKANNILRTLKLSFEITNDFIVKYKVCNVKIESNKKYRVLQVESNEIHSLYQLMSEKRLFLNSKNKLIVEINDKKWYKIDYNNFIVGYFKIDFNKLYFIKTDVVKKYDVNLVLAKLIKYKIDFIICDEELFNIDCEKIYYQEL